MASYYDDLLQICGFDDEEIEKERSRIEEVFRRLEMGPGDIERAEKWTRQNHDVELPGLRKILRLWLKELFDLVLARDEGRRLIYYGFPTIAGPAGTLAASSGDVLVTCPDVVLCHTMGQIFNNLNPVLEIGEANGLPPGYGLCSLQQVRLGAMVKGIIPVPDLALTSSYYCDMGSKNDELLHEKFGHPAIYVDGSMDSRMGEFPEYVMDRVDFLGGEIEKIFYGAHEILGLEITDEARAEGASRNRELMGALSVLADLVNSADPQPLSVVDLEMARRLAIGSASRRLLSEGFEAVKALNEGVKERINRGVGVVEKGAPKVMIYLSHFSDPSIGHMMENCNLSISQTFLTAIASKYRKNTPYIAGDVLAREEMARGSFHSTWGVVTRAAEIIKEAAFDGVIWNYLFNCRPISVPAYIVKDYVEKNMGIPVLALEFDLADSRTYGAGAMKLKVEAFAEMLRARKAARKYER